MSMHRRIVRAAGLGVGLLIAGCGPSDGDGGTGADARHAEALAARGDETTASNGEVASPHADGGTTSMPAQPADRGDPSPGGDGDRAIELPGLTITLAPSWRAIEPSSSMRKAEAALPAGEGGEDASLVVYYFGPKGAGTHEANLARWASQFVLPDGTDPADAATVEKIERGEHAIIVMRLAGTYIAETSPGSGQRHNKPDWALVGVIVETGEGPYYIKIVGPGDVLKAHANEIEAMIASLEPA